MREKRKRERLSKSRVVVYGTRRGSLGAQRERRAREKRGCVFAEDYIYGTSKFICLHCKHKDRGSRNLRNCVRVVAVRARFDRERYLAVGIVIYIDNCPRNFFV